MHAPYLKRLKLYLHNTMLVRCSQLVEKGQKLLAFFFGKGAIAVFILYSSTCQNSHISSRELSGCRFFEMMVNTTASLTRRLVTSLVKRSHNRSRNNKATSR